jgi:hypothetical protein
MSEGHYIERRLSLFFIQLVGGDYRLLLSSGNLVIHRFFGASISLVLVMIVSVCSVFYGTDLLFHIWQVELMLAFFISLLFGFIYIFLLTTLSRLTRQTAKLNLSNTLRLGFLLFMAFLISKPVEVFFFSKKLDKQIAEHRNALLKNFENKLNIIYEADKVRLEARIRSLDLILSDYFIAAYAEEWASVKEKMALLGQERETKLQLAKQRIQQADFLLFRIELVVKMPASWIICLIFLGLFLLPAIFIYSIPHEHIYYDKKIQLERFIIQTEYKKFCDQYSQIFLKNWSVHTEVYTVYQDPPFNTQRIPEVVPRTKVQFIELYLGKS